MRMNVIPLITSVTFLWTAVPSVAEETSFTFAGSSDVLSFDPYTTTDGFSHNILHQIYESLVGIDENMQFVPKLAESWQNISPLVWEC